MAKVKIVNAGGAPASQYSHRHELLYEKFPSKTIDPQHPVYSYIAFRQVAGKGEVIGDGLSEVFVDANAAELDPAIQCRMSLFPAPRYLRLGDEEGFHGDDDECLDYLRHEPQRSECIKYMIETGFNLDDLILVKHATDGGTGRGFFRFLSEDAPQQVTMRGILPVSMLPSTTVKGGMKPRAANALKRLREVNTRSLKSRQILADILMDRDCCKLQEKLFAAKDYSAARDYYTQLKEEGASRVLSHDSVTSIPLTLGDRFQERVMLPIYSFGLVGQPGYEVTTIPKTSFDCGDFKDFVKGYFVVPGYASLEQENLEKLDTQIRIPLLCATTVPFDPREVEGSIVIVSLPHKIFPEFAKVYQKVKEAAIHTINAPVELYATTGFPFGEAGRIDVWTYTCLPQIPKQLEAKLS